MIILSNAELERLPGWEIVSTGLADIASRRVTPSACAASIALPRLRRHGLMDERQLAGQIAEPERTLYRLLGQAGDNAYGRYNTILARVCRFERALDSAIFRKARRSRSLGEPGSDH